MKTSSHHIDHFQRAHSFFSFFFFLQFFPSFYFFFFFILTSEIFSLPLSSKKERYYELKYATVPSRTRGWSRDRERGKKRRKREEMFRRRQPALQPFSQASTKGMLCITFFSILHAPCFLFLSYGGFSYFAILNCVSHQFPSVFYSSFFLMGSNREK